MEHERKSPTRRFVFEDARNVLIGVARMDHQRQAGFARSGDVPPETGSLRRVVALIVIVEADLPDGDAAWVRTQPHELGSRDFRLFMRVVRMRADRAPDLRVL